MLAIGGLMMIGVVVALWRGTMLSIDVPQPKMTGSMLSVFGHSRRSRPSTPYVGTALRDSQRRQPRPRPRFISI